jgi:23S rRNA (cytosine1962-C5)-methyltransferase
LQDWIDHVISSDIAGQVFLKPKRAQPFYGRHPWVFAGAIDRIEGDPPDGAVVDVRSHVGNFVARGLFNSKSKITVRLYSWDEAVAIDREFFKARLQRAIDFRHDTLKLNHGPEAAYRVAFSEADQLSGMIVDRYGEYLTVQFTSLALAERRQMIGELLMEMLGAKGVYLRTEKGIGKLEGVVLQDGLLCGEMPPAEVVIHENGLKFAVNLNEGQKTGYYLDQRDNRAAVARFGAGKRVLDAFCYSGGFGMYAAKAGAVEIECLDASEPALKLAERNAELNGFTGFTFSKGDVFTRLEELANAGRTFDIVVLDPPKFARDRAAIPDAIKGYRRLHALAMKLLTPNGILASCCCTGLVTMDMLEDVIAQTAVAAKRDVQIFERRGPSADHPVAVSCREGTYLKCIISRVV